MPYIELTEEERGVLDVIADHSKDSKIKDPEIRLQVSVHDPDHEKPGAGLRKVINSLRKKGFPICSDTRGYWYASSRMELLESAEALKGRAYKILEAAKGMERAAEQYDTAQERLFEIRKNTIEI